MGPGSGAGMTPEGTFLLNRTPTGLCKVRCPFNTRSMSTNPTDTARFQLRNHSIILNLDPLSEPASDFELPLGVIPGADPGSMTPELKGKVTR